MEGCRWKSGFDSIAADSTSLDAVSTYLVNWLEEGILLSLGLYLVHPNEVHHMMEQDSELLTAGLDLFSLLVDLVSCLVRLIALAQPQRLSDKSIFASELGNFGPASYYVNLTACRVLSFRT